MPEAVRNEKGKEREGRTECPFLPRRDQLAVAVLAAMCLLAQFAWRGLTDAPVDIDRAARRTQRFSLDINRAEWPEWTLLPRVGETLARRIVESRRENGPFRSAEDLLRVRGIGPKTLEYMRPYLMPEP